MKIIRNKIISKEKYNPAPGWANYKHYHKIEMFIDYENDIIKIIIVYDYLIGHGAEMLDKIHIYNEYHAILKTHDKNEITIDKEQEMIKKLINYNKNKINKNNIEIQLLNNYNNDLNNYNKKLNYNLRNEKIKTIISNN